MSESQGVSLAYSKSPPFLRHPALWGRQSPWQCTFPHQKGILHDLLGEIGGVITSQIPGRINPEDITIFDSTRIALQGLASAAVILDAAAQAGAGCSVIL